MGNSGLSYLWTSVGIGSCTRLSNGKIEIGQTQPKGSQTRPVLELIMVPGIGTLYSNEVLLEKKKRIFEVRILRLLPTFTLKIRTTGPYVNSPRLV